MELQCQSPVSILDLLFLSVSGDAKCLVEAPASRSTHSMQLGRIVVLVVDGVT